MSETSDKVTKTIWVARVGLALIDLFKALGLILMTGMIQYYKIKIKKAGDENQWLKTKEKIRDQRDELKEKVKDKSSTQIIDDFLNDK